MRQRNPSSFSLSTAIREISLLFFSPTSSGLLEMVSNVSTVYLHVIEDVISKVREEYVSSDAVNGVLTELQALWETKMMQCRAISGNIDRSSIPKPVVVNAPTSLQTHMRITGTADLFNIPTGQYDFSPMSEH